MRFSLSWLRDYVDVEVEPEDLARRLTLAGLAVEQIDRPAAIPETVVVARIVEAVPHPNADRLTLCRVDHGEGDPVPVVCGAPNARTGLLTALARVGTRLPGGLTIRKSKIRGEVSQGMLCSPIEIGLGDDADGILELSEGTPGTPLGSTLPPGEVAFEIDVPSNRGDCLSHVGVAREIAALTGVACRAPDAVEGTGTPAAADTVSVEIEDPVDCGRFTAHVIRDLAVGPSPDWLVRRLEAAGQRSINNVVDITNFIMLETGQPLHAFDLDLVGTGRIRVRRARAGERITTLDDVDRALTPEVLLITDGERPIAVGGVMGGANTEVHEGTRNILLEAAWFRPERVLRGSRDLRLDTEAAIRFRRGVDPRGVAAAARRCAQLLAEVAGGTVAAGMAEVVAPDLLQERTVAFRPRRVRELLGDAPSEPEIETRLGSLGFRRSGTGETWTVEVPSWRQDILEECDLIEEVARHGGYDRIGTRDYNASAVSAAVQPEEKRLRRVAAVLTGFGFHEARTRNLVGAGHATRVGIEAGVAERDFVSLLDPPTREEEGLRVSLLPSLLDVIAHNLRHGQTEVRIFEIGTTFHRADEELPRETAWVGLAAAGGVPAPSLEREAREYGVADLKGAVEALLEAFRIDGCKWREYNAVGLVPPGAIEVLVEGESESAGFVWSVEDRFASAFDLNRPVFLAQVRLDVLPLEGRTPVVYREPSRYPAVRRDLALVVPEGPGQDQVRTWIASDAGKHLEGIELFDHYRGKHIPAGHVGLGYRLVFRSGERTLTEEEIDAVVSRIVDGLRKRGITLREA